jgi:predicted lipoprotein with Yx(FWY)xxD motif
MKKFFISVSLFCMLSAMAQKFETQKLTDAQGYTYETVKNDQAGVSIHPEERTEGLSCKK